MGLIDSKGCECLNESKVHPYQHALSLSEAEYLESADDEQLMIFLTFRCPVKLNSLQLIGPTDGMESMLGK